MCRETIWYYHLRILEKLQHPFSFPNYISLNADVNLNKRLLQGLVYSSKIL